MLPLSRSQLAPPPSLKRSAGRGLEPDSREARTCSPLKGGAEEKGSIPKGSLKRYPIAMILTGPRQSGVSSSKGDQHGARCRDRPPGDQRRRLRDVEGLLRPADGVSRLRR